MTALTQNRLREVLNYDPETGEFVRKISVTYNALAGDQAGNKTGNGYLEIRVDGRSYLAHRLAWLYMTGAMPDQQIDHKNRIKIDNRWSNLRAASQSQNLANIRRHKDNKSGFKGVSRSRVHGKYHAHIRINGKNRYLGTFSDPADAHAAYVSAAMKAFGEFARAS